MFLLKLGDFRLLAGEFLFEIFEFQTIPTVSVHGTIRRLLIDQYVDAKTDNTLETVFANF